ncbi:MAG: acyl-CoA thioesterase II [Leucobacter sp.]
MSATPDLVTMLSVLDSGARTRDDILTGPAVPTPHGRAFGGQVLGQALAAAATTVPEERLLHSMHGYFLRPGDSEQRMTFEVARLHDGRSFSTRRTQAYQNGVALMSLIASYQEPDDGVEHQDTRDLSDLPAPESLPSVWEKYGHLADGGRASWVLNRPFDFRYVESDIIMSVENRAASQRVWLRARDTMPDEAALHTAALAFASDYLLLEPVLRRHGIPWATPALRGASLDHAMWFHRPFRVDDWLLYELETPTAQGARGLTHGRFYDRDGSLVASVSQESMIHVPSDAD